MTVATTNEIWPVQLGGNQWQTNTANSQTLQVSSSHPQSCESIFAVQYFSSDGKNGKRQNREYTDAWLFLCGAAQTFFQCSMEWFILLLCKAFVFSPFPEFLPSKKLLQPHNHTLIWNCTLKNKSVANGQVQLRNNHYHEQNLSGTASKCILYVPDLCHHSYHWNTTALLM